MAATVSGGGGDYGSWAIAATAGAAQAAAPALPLAGVELQPLPRRCIVVWAFVRACFLPAGAPATKAGELQS
eukprot:6190257-Pleurochrysis_carterae.AAC.4